MMPFIFHPHFACRNFSATKLPTVLGQHFFHRLTLVNSPALAERRVVPVASSHLFTLSLVYWCLLISVLPNITKPYFTPEHSEKYWAWQLVEWQSLQIGGSGGRLVSRPFTSERPHLIRITGMDRWRTVIQGGDIGAAAWSPGHCAGFGETYCNHGGMLALNHLGQQTCLEH